MWNASWPISVDYRPGSFGIFRRGKGKFCGGIESEEELSQSMPRSLLENAPDKAMMTASAGKYWQSFLVNQIHVHRNITRMLNFRQGRVKRLMGTTSGMPETVEYLEKRGNERRRASDVPEEVEAIASKPSSIPADTLLMSSTDSEYLSGLDTAKSGVCEQDPYLHSAVQHKKWIDRAVERLGDLATLKFGNTRELLRQFDPSLDRAVNFEEFSKGMTMCQLEQFFPRSLQRTLFDAVDTGKTGTVGLAELDDFLTKGTPQVRKLAPGAPEGSEGQRDRRQVEDFEARAVQLQPIRDHRTQRIKNKLLLCLNSMIPNASPGLADNRVMFLEKRLASLRGESNRCNQQNITAKDLVRVLGPQGLGVEVDEEDIRRLVTDLGRGGGGGEGSTITLKELAHFINLDDDEPLYQSLFDSRRRNLSILQSAADAPLPEATEDDKLLVARLDELHSAAVPSKRLDEAVRRQRKALDPESEGRDRCGHAPRSPASSTGQESPTVTTPSGRTVLDVWNLPPRTRHLSGTRQPLTRSMRSLPLTRAKDGDPAKFAFGSSCGGTASELDSTALDVPRPELRGGSSVSSSEELFSSLNEARLQEAAAGAQARARKVPKSTWADIGHGGVGHDAGTDESSSFFASADERFTTTNSERYGPFLKEKKIEKGQRYAGLYRLRPGDSAAEASNRRRRSDDRSNKIRAHLERIALCVKSEEIAARVKEERRVRGKIHTRLRYMKWINGQDNWLRDDVPRLASYARRQFPAQSTRLRAGQQVREALGGLLSPWQQQPPWGGEMVESCVPHGKNDR